jgi:hypothetical protein
LRCFEAIAELAAPPMAKDRTSFRVGVDMSIDAHFIPPALRPGRREVAFVKDRLDRGYLRDIRRFEMLERDQEYNLAKCWREHGDHSAAHQLVATICGSSPKSL